MGRLGWLLCLTVACSPPLEATAPAPTSSAPAPTTETTAPPGKADTARPRPTPDDGIACPRAGQRTCDPGAEPLRCVNASGGAVWMPADPCPNAHRCVPDHGCLPLPECGDVGLIGCVHQALFVCEATDAGGLEWAQATMCPEALPCVNGRGCPNPMGIGTPCAFVDPPRCTPDGRIMVCTLDGIDAVWDTPRECGVGTSCVAGQGCRAEEETDPEAPTSPPKGQRAWR